MRRPVCVNKTAKSSLRNLYIVAFLFFTFLASAQNNDVNFFHVTDAEGLPLGFTQQVLYDTTGMAWISGWDRIYQYDGYDVTRHESFIGNQALTISGRTEIILRNDGLFWVMDDFQVFVLNPYTFSVDSIFMTKEIFRSFNVQNAAMKMATNGTLWVVSNFEENNEKIKKSYLLQITHGQTTITDTLHSKGSNSPTLELLNDTLFVTHYEKIKRYTSTGQKIPSIELPPTGVFFTYTYMDIHGNLWIKGNTIRDAQDKYVFVLTKGSTEVSTCTFPSTIDLSRTKDFIVLDSVMWIGGINGELIKYNLKTQEQNRYADHITSLPNFPFTGSETVDIIVEKQDIQWLTTSHGLIKILTKNYPIQSYLTDKNKHCLYEFCSIRGMAEDESGNIYISYYENVHKLDKASGEFYSIIPDNYYKYPGAYSLTYCDDKLYWVDHVIDLTTGKVSPLFPDEKNGHSTSCADDQGNLWIYVWGDTGLRKYNQHSKELTDIKLPKNLQINGLEINDMIWDQGLSCLWVMTSNSGVIQISEHGTVLNQYSTKSSSTIPLPTNNAKVGYVEGNQLWVGHTSGLSRINKEEKTIDNFTVTPSDNYEIVGILPQDNDYLWVSTNLGIFKFNKDNGQFLGLPSSCVLSDKEFNRASYFKTRDGKMYFGSLSGFYSFYPDSLEAYLQSNINYSLLLTKLAIYNADSRKLLTTTAKANQLTKIELSASDRFFTLHYSLPYYQSEDAITYSHKLVGYDNQWSQPSSDHQVRFDNLPSGTYTLLIRGGGNQLGIPESQRQIEVIVLQAWYLRWWAYMLYAVFLIGITYLIYRGKFNRQLVRQEARRLKELDLFKSKLYTNLTHEFRTPLTVIMGIAESMKGNNVERDLILRNSNNLLRLVNQLLDLSKIEKGSMAVDYVYGDIIPYLRYLSESFHSMAERSHIKLLFYPELNECFMDYDSEKIQHIVYNLLSNALKFTPEHGQIIFNVRKIDQQSNTLLQIKISDTGKGISVDDQKHIFDRFYQAEAHSPGKSRLYYNGGGTGIGLALVKELVNLMEGEIAIESQLEKGSHFIIKLPIHHSGANRQMIERVYEVKIDDPSQTAVVDDKLTLTLDHRNNDTDAYLILVIEDNADVAYYMKHILDPSYSVMLAKDGQEGIQLALEMVPDIIVSDVMMPKKDGYQVCDTLKSDQRTSHIPIILLTAKATHSDKLAGLRHGADAYLMKPFDKDELFIRIEKLISLRNQLQVHYIQMSSKDAQAVSQNTESVEGAFIQKARNLILSKIADSDLSIDELAQVLGLSKMQFYRKIKALTGQSPTLFIRSVRLHRAIELLKSKELNISEVAYATGFSDPGYFSRVFKEEFGKTPSEVD